MLSSIVTELLIVNFLFIYVLGKEGCLFHLKLVVFFFLLVILVRYLILYSSIEVYSLAIRKFY